MMEKSLLVELVLLQQLRTGEVLMRRSACR
jgi:hypothetical protein